MEFKGTKGKWTTFYDDFDGYGVRLVEEGFSFGMVQIATNICQGESEGYADAKLISKAPELLEKLISIMNISEDKGVPGCTYGDTDMSSVDVCYGYNLALEQVKHGIEKLIKEATTL